MANWAAEMTLGCVYEGSIVMEDSLIERRPYHRNCGCALHKLKGPRAMPFISALPMATGLSL
ncbi:hypothetical protein CCACVL1_29279 [Corchorus capsularis]|uniref:Uncharacterized protein n=1 Tax=Corchorus capsularis TaxID=210143 RepID=A0A1R3G2J4_COCAP|nr:hypothetical protein CCACVL1_29279 [Corchorus capsularis]